MQVNPRVIDPSSMAFCPSPSHSLVVGWKDGAITYAGVVFEAQICTELHKCDTVISYCEVGRRASVEAKEAVSVHASAAGDCAAASALPPHIVTLSQ